MTGAPRKEHEDGRTEVERCHRCDVEMTLQPMREGSATEAWFCPCCKSHLRTVAMLQADAEKRAAERGITVEELFEQSAKVVRKPTEEEVSDPQLMAWLDHMREEWTPACEHDTQNPWRAA